MINKICIDLLAGNNYIPRVLEFCELMAELYPEEKLTLGFLVRAKGWDDGYKVIRKVAKLDNVDTIRVHGLWLDSHTFREGHIKETVEIGEKVSKIAAKHKDVKFYYSPCLEHRMDRALAKKFRKANQYDNLTFVNCFIDGGHQFKKGINEIHHRLLPLTSNYIHSWDGIDQYDSDVQRYKNIHKNALANMAWCYPFNQKYSKKDPTKREDRKLVPPLKLLESLAVQLMVEADSHINLMSNRIYKAFSEPEQQGSHATPNPRSWKMAYLTPFKGDVEFKVKGKVIAKFHNTGSMHGDQYIYRCDKWGLDAYREVIKVKPNGLVHVWEGDKKVGKVNPLFRANYFRN